MPRAAFCISYAWPDQPSDRAAVTAAVVLLADRATLLQVARRPDGQWELTIDRQPTATPSWTFAGAVTLAHLTAYLVASDQLADTPALLLGSP